MTARQLHKETEPFIVEFGEFRFELIEDLSEFNSDIHIIFIKDLVQGDDSVIDLSHEYTKTEIAISFIKRSLRDVAKDILESTKNKRRKK